MQTLLGLSILGSRTFFLSVFRVSWLNFNFSVIIYWHPKGLLLRLRQSTYTRLEHSNSRGKIKCLMFFRIFTIRKREVGAAGESVVRMLHTTDSAAQRFSTSLVYSTSPPFSKVFYIATRFLRSFMFATLIRRRLKSIKIFRESRKIASRECRKATVYVA